MTINITPIGKSQFLVVLSIIVALVITVLPIPIWALPFWPEWTILVVIYWCLASPHKFNLKFAWIAGLLMDLIKSSLLGQHALSYLLVAYICAHIHQRLRVYPLFQQAIAIGGLLLPYFLLNFGIDHIHHSATLDWRYWTPIISNILLWPWVFSVLGLVSQKALR